MALDDSSRLSITSIGNCQSLEIVKCLRIMRPDIDFDHIRYCDRVNVAERFREADPERQMFLVQNPVMTFNADIAALRATYRIIDYPAITYSGFHPDVIRPLIDGRLVPGPMGTNHSSIILHAFRQGIARDDVASLFRDDVFDALGFHEHKRASDDHLAESFRELGLYDIAIEREIAASGCFMHCPVHPKLPIIAMLARAMLAKLGLPPRISYPENIMADEMAGMVVWPIYPAIAERLGLRGGEYIFQHKHKNNSIYTLEDFIRISYEHYQTVDLDQLSHPRLSDENYEDIGRFLRTRPSAARSNNPYSGLGDHHFWRRAVERIDPPEFDPVIKPPFVLEATTRVATAGSCFAQHIARRLAASGHCYLVTEAGAELDEKDRSRRNYGVYSARYGNLYTVRQLLQLFARAYGEFLPHDEAWRRADGRFIDPFRPEIEPDGFADPADVAAARDVHLKAVRDMFEQADVLVFTLGLTEGWRSRKDGAVFPLCPGVVSPDLDLGDYEFVNFDYASILEDFTAFRDKLLAVNPACRLILTVSPVPLVATYEDRHVVVSTTASKSILRAVADQASREAGAVSYFPSYEIISNPFLPNQYFEQDRRSVAATGVDHVMRVFLRHYSRLTDAPKGNSIAKELAVEQRVVCEEERLDS